MAEMFGNRKPRIPVSKDDIKKATLAANKRLKNANNKLEQENKEAKAQAKEAAKQQKALEKEILVLSKDKESLESDVSSLKSDTYKVNVKIKDASSRYDELCNLVAGAEAGFVKLDKRNKSLEKSIALLEDKKKETSAINAELKAFKSSKATIEDDISTLSDKRDDMQGDVASFELDKVAAKASYDSLKQELFQQETSIRDILQRMNNKIEVVEDLYIKKAAEYDSMIADKMEEVATLDSILAKKENEYITAENSIKAAERKVKAADMKADSSIAFEEKKISTIKENFKKWKLTALEEVAIMKMKKKLINIDKAGLKDILGE